VCFVSFPLLLCAKCLSHPFLCNSFPSVSSCRGNDTSQPRRAAREHDSQPAILTVVRTPPRLFGRLATIAPACAVRPSAREPAPHVSLPRCRPRASRPLAVPTCACPVTGRMRCAVLLPPATASCKHAHANAAAAAGRTHACAVLLSLAVSRPPASSYRHRLQPALDACPREEGEEKDGEESEHA
jgi:hypothetical protein